MNTPHPFDLVIGLDRSDRKADLHHIDTRTGQRWSRSIDTAAGGALAMAAAVAPTSIPKPAWLCAWNNRPFT